MRPLRLLQDARVISRVSRGQARDSTLSSCSGCMPRRAMAGASAQKAQKGAMAAALTTFDPCEHWGGKPGRVTLTCGFQGSCNASRLSPGPPCEQAQDNPPSSGCMPRRAMAGASAQKAQKGATAAALKTFKHI